MLVENLALSTLMVALTVVIHFAGLASVSAIVRRRLHARPEPGPVVVQGAGVVAVVLLLFALHMIEIWTYAIVYLMLDQFETLEIAVYFSTSTFTTVGFGDLVLGEDWRLFSAIQSANGFLLIGWSTAYLVTVITRVRDVEREQD